VSALRVEFPDCVVVSALSKDGLDGLRDELFHRSAARVRRSHGRRGAVANSSSDGAV